MPVQSLFFQKIIGQDPGLFENGPLGAFGHVTGMVGDGGITVGFIVVPDLMTSVGLTVKGKSQGFKAFDDLTVIKA